MTYDELVQRTVTSLSQSLDDRQQGIQRRTRTARLAKRSRLIANSGRPINFPMNEVEDFFLDDGPLDSIDFRNRG